MPTQIPAGMRLGMVDPADAVAAFERRSLLQPSYAWQDVWQDEHARGFAVAGVQRLDVLKVFQDELASAIKDGRDLAGFRDQVVPKLTAKGFWGDVEVTDPETGEKRITRFDERRLQTIFDVNMRQSFAAGRWARIQRTKDRMPFIIYWTMQDEHVRATHRTWDALVLPVDHPFWDTHFPPNGWGCRCYAHAIDEKGIEKLRRAGVKVKTEPPRVDWITYVNPRTGEVVPVPRGIDPGFAYNPGKERDAAQHEASLRKALTASPLSGAVAVAQAQADFPAFVASMTARFGPFVDQVAQAGQASGALRFIGAMPVPAVRALASQGIEPATAVIAVRDVDVLQTLRMAGAGAALEVGLYRRLPELLARASAVLAEISSEPRMLHYVVDLVDQAGGARKLVVRVELGGQAALGGRVPLNLVRNATIVEPAELLDRSRFQLLWGRGGLSLG